MRRFLVGCSLLLACNLAQAADDVLLDRLRAALDAVRQEQQSVYQQFQMTESLQRSERLGEDPASPPVHAPEGQAPSYTDAVRARHERQDRVKYYSEEMRRLSGRYRELEVQSRALVDQMRALAQPGG